MSDFPKVIYFPNSNSFRVVAEDYELKGQEQFSNYETLRSDIKAALDDCGLYSRISPSCNC